MQIILQREAILKPLSYVAGVVEKRQTLPILSFVLLRQEGDTVSLTGTDLEVEIIAKVKAERREDSELMLPARKLLDICRALPDGATIDIRKDGDKAVVKSGKSRFTLMSLPAAEFPDLQVAQWDHSLNLSQRALKNLILQTHFCMAQQDVRYFLNGLLFELSGGTLRVVATDGHRMAVSETSLEKPQSSPGKQVIVPRKGVHEIARLLEDSDEDTEVLIGSNHLCIRTGNFVLTTKLIDGKYPDYAKVVPPAQSKTLRIERETLREALGRAAILSNEKYRGVRLTLISKGLKISSHNPEQEEAQEEVTADYDGDVLEIGFNVSYMIEAISSLQGQHVTIGLTDANSSCTITAPDTKTPLYVIMPMRL
jgi:DNA polymerase-3 subunit beta